MKSIDIRSEAAVNLLAEFLDMDTGNNGGGRKNAEHFAHGEFLFCFHRNIYFSGVFMEYDYGGLGSTSQGRQTSPDQTDCCLGLHFHAPCISISSILASSYALSFVLSIVRTVIGY
jgi:hypothetical protein